MPNIKDKNYLLANQYGNISKYKTRVEFHRKHSTHQQNWYQWVFDRILLTSNYRVLELGCGLGDLWNENRSRLLKTPDVTISDISIGMVAYSKANLGNEFKFTVCDIQSIPFEDELFDVVIANHVLYHVADRANALNEIHRVLKANGHVYATTVGNAHLRELSRLLQKFDPSLDFFWSASLQDTFTLENGSKQLSGWFNSVRLERYEDKLKVSEAEPIVKFVLASSDARIGKEKIAQFNKFLADELDRQHELYITRDLGLFLGTRA